MLVYTCEVCGKVKKTYAHTAGRFCSHHCQGIAMTNKKMTPRYQQGNCVFYPESVICGERNCTNCGWNPVVAKARLEKFLEEHHEFTL